MCALAVAGCSGGGSGPAPRGPSAGAGVPVTVVVRWPGSAQSTSNRRAPQYVSNGTKSITVAIDSGTATVLDNPNLSPGTASAPTQTTSYTVDLAPGSHAFAISDFDAIGGLGHLLAKTVVNSTVVADTANTISATLDGNLASISVQAKSDPFLVDAKPTYTVTGPATQTFDMVPLDAAGDVIVSPGALPAIAVTSATPASVAVASTSTVNEFAVRALAPDASVVLTATGHNLAGTAVTATFTVKTLGALVVDDQQNFIVKIFDENGKQIVLPTGAFAGLNAVHGIAYIPGSASVPDALMVADDGNESAPTPPAPPYVHAFDLYGNATALPSSAFSTVDESAYWRYFPALQKFYVPGGNKASIYDPTGNFVAYFQPSSFSGVEYVASGNAGKGEIFVTGYSRILGLDTTGATTLSQTANSTVTGQPAFKQAEGIVYDANLGHLFVAAIDATTNKGTVLEFDSTLAAVTHLPTAFTDTNNPTTGIAYPSGIAFDPVSKIFYVTNYRKFTGDTQTGVYAFTETGGAASNVPATGFGGLNGPADIVFLP